MASRPLPCPSIPRLWTLHRQGERGRQECNWPRRLSEARAAAATSGPARPWPGRPCSTRDDLQREGWKSATPAGPVDEPQCAVTGKGIARLSVRDRGAYGDIRLGRECRHRLGNRPVARRRRLGRTGDDHRGLLLVCRGGASESRNKEQHRAGEDKTITFHRKPPLFLWRLTRANPGSTPGLPERISAAWSSNKTLPPDLM